MRSPHRIWLLLMIGVQLIGLIALRHLIQSDFGPGSIPPENVVGRAQWWCGVFAIAGGITSLGATYWLLRRAHAIVAAACIGLLTVPAGMLSGWAGLIWLAGLGWW